MGTATSYGGSATKGTADERRGATATPPNGAAAATGEGQDPTPSTGLRAASIPAQPQANDATDQTGRS
eukprot:59366-Chlamydomonas_euryale.AAC.1